jgi:hypothetical protein
MLGPFVILKVHCIVLVGTLRQSAGGGGCRGGCGRRARAAVAVQLYVSYSARSSKVKILAELNRVDAVHAHRRQRGKAVCGNTLQTKAGAACTRARATTQRDRGEWRCWTCAHRGHAYEG